MLVSSYYASNMTLSFIKCCFREKKKTVRKDTKTAEVNLNSVHHVGTEMNARQKLIFFSDDIMKSCLIDIEEGPITF